MRLPRASGVLLHPTSLPGRFGIGDLGPSAESFVDFLANTGQRWWQMLPLGPAGFGGSPYQSSSSHAGNPLLISPERLVEDGYLERGDLDGYPELPHDRVDFDAVAAAKDAVLERAFARFGEGSGDAEFATFLDRNAGWLEDYSLFRAIKEAIGEGLWNEWEPGLVAREPSVLSRWRQRLAPRIRFVQFVQYQFDRQWFRLRNYCRDRDVHLIGDLPIFVSLDSVDVWTRPDLFLLDEAGRPTHVAGVPPDYFSATGQLWGNPLYRWEAHAEERYAWWIERLLGTIERVELVRLDHFRGFEAYWEVPAGEATAVNGRWALGPGAAFFEAIRASLGCDVPLIAEDLGEITFEVEALRDRFELPGMRVLQFAFSTDPKSRDYLPYSYVPNCVVYTGTHDNDTTLGWYTTPPDESTLDAEAFTEERDFARRYVGTDGREIHWDMIRLAMSSVAHTAILPLQDILGLGTEARMNVPGRAQGNWAWRYRHDQLSPEAADRLAEMTNLYSRRNGGDPPRYRIAATDQGASGATREASRDRLRIHKAIDFIEGT